MIEMYWFIGGIVVGGFSTAVAFVHSDLMSRLHSVPPATELPKYVADHYQTIADMPYPPTDTDRGERG